MRRFRSIWFEDLAKSEFCGLIPTSCCGVWDAAQLCGIRDGEAVPVEEPDEFGLVFREPVDSVADLDTGIGGDADNALGRR